MSEKKYSSHFRCPHCQRIIEKPASYQIFAGGTGIGMMTTVEDACPFCGRGINRMAIINGNYDYRQPFPWGCLLVVIVIAVVIVSMLIHG
ncbi:MAG: hypothetical protein KW806_03275 [Candidatus Yanofskybacteria bacterium]|nr:hypothetical protein [Candidatus Yanofskybacteria bacterium]